MNPAIIGAECDSFGSYNSVIELVPKHDRYWHRDVSVSGGIPSSVSLLKGIQLIRDLLSGCGQVPETAEPASVRRCILIGQFSLGIQRNRVEDYLSSAWS